jgi:hypothetical protein
MDERAEATVVGDSRARRRYQNSVIIAVSILVALAIVAAVAVWFVVRKLIAKDCQSCRLKPMCSRGDPERCETSYDALVRLDGLMNDCAREYASSYGGGVPVFYLKEHPSRSFSYMKTSVYVVLRKGDGTLYDKDTLAFVGLHELAHVLCNELDGDKHGPRFVLVFDRLLEIAKRKGYYDGEAPFDADYPSGG